MDYLSLCLILPVALTVAVGTIQCVMFADEVGDKFGIRASMVGDGLATTISSACGGIFGMTVYLGYPQFKKMGARVSYNLVTAAFFLVVSAERRTFTTRHVRTCETPCPQAPALTADSTTLHSYAARALSPPSSRSSRLAPSTR